MDIRTALLSGETRKCKPISHASKDEPKSKKLSVENDAKILEAYGITVVLQQSKTDSALGDCKENKDINAAKAECPQDNSKDNRLLSPKKEKSTNLDKKPCGILTFESPKIPKLVSDNDIELLSDKSKKSDDSSCDEWNNSVNVSLNTSELSITGEDKGHNPESKAKDVGQNKSDGKGQTDKEKVKKRKMTPAEAKKRAEEREEKEKEVPHYKLSCHLKEIKNTFKSSKNLPEFCKFRPAYGMFLTGVICLFVFVTILTQVKEWSVKDDFYCVALKLSVSMVMLITAMYFIANAVFDITAKDYDLYTQFEEFVHVPMKIVVDETVAIFLTSKETYSLLKLFIAFLMVLCITSSDYWYHATEIDDVLSLSPLFLLDQRLVMKYVIIVMIVLFMLNFIGMVVAAFLEAKNSILCIIEKNRQQNLIAIGFLLPDTEAESLEDLKAALKHKRTQPLTEEEEAAFKYISWPIWRTKTNVKPDEQDESGNNKTPELVKVKHFQVDTCKSVVHEVPGLGGPGLFEDRIKEKLELFEFLTSAVYRKEQILGSS